MQTNFPYCTKGEDGKYRFDTNFDIEAYSAEKYGDEYWDEICEEYGLEYDDEYMQTNFPNCVKGDDGKYRFDRTYNA